MATVQFCDVRKAFGPIQVLLGVSVDIADGEFVVLVGPSGCEGFPSRLTMILSGAMSRCRRFCPWI